MRRRASRLLRQWMRLEGKKLDRPCQSDEGEKDSISARVSQVRNGDASSPPPYEHEHCAFEVPPHITEHSFSRSAKGQRRRIYNRWKYETKMRDRWRNECFLSDLVKM